MTKILVLDNYDSFTYNIVQLVNKLTNTKTTVILNDQINLEEVKKFDKIILSPGPGVPKEAGLLLPLINSYAKSKSILGVCLGHQAIGESFGATIINLPKVYHGVSSKIAIHHKTTEYKNELFKNLPSFIEVGRYHSWAIDKETLPKDFTITAEDDNGIVMAIQHNNLDVQGIQFHPESVMTPTGENMLKNWLQC